MQHCFVGNVINGVCCLLMQLAACMGVFWCISVLVFFYSDFLGISHYAIPVILASIMVTFFLNPLHILFYDARKWVVRTAVRYYIFSFKIFYDLSERFL